VAVITFLSRGEARYFPEKMSFPDLLTRPKLALLQLPRGEVCVDAVLRLKTRRHRLFGSHQLRATRVRKRRREGEPRVARLRRGAASVAAVCGIRLRVRDGARFAPLLLGRFFECSCGAYFAAWWA
jgi:hypothetical protein